MKNILKNTMTKKNIIRFSILLISLTISSLVYNIFLLPLNLVTGGTSGIATITHYLYGFNPALMIFILCSACIIISLMYLGIERTLSSVTATILFPILVELTSPVQYLLARDPDKLLLVLFAGVLGGVANGLIYKTGYNSGGLTVISQTLAETKKISIAKTSFIVNAIVVLIGAYFFGTTNALYAIIYLYINNIVTDKVLLGISNNKAFYIITDEDEKVKEYILKTVKHDVTIFDVRGGFLEQKRKVLLTVVPSREYYIVTEGIKEIDKDVFFVVTDAYQVEGGK